MTIWIKYLLTALVVVLISEVAKRSDKLAALIGSLPLVTVLSLIWLFIEQQPPDKISLHAYYTFWYVLCTLPFFVLFPYLFGKFSFMVALLLSVLLTLVFFSFFALILQQFDIDIL